MIMNCSKNASELTDLNTNYPESADRSIHIDDLSDLPDHTDEEIEKEWIGWVRSKIQDARMQIQDTNDRIQIRTNQINRLQQLNRHDSMILDEIKGDFDDFRASLKK